MGTNFYLKRIPTEEELSHIRSAVNVGNLDEARQLIDDTDIEIHIGKRSSGWQFLFDLSPEGMGIPINEFSLMKAKRYLEKMVSNGWKLQNEYRQVFTPDQFWEEINNWLYLDENHCDLEKYYEEHPNEIRYLQMSQGKSEDGLRYDKRTFS